MIETLAIKDWDEDIPLEIKQHALQALEGGHVIYCPQLPFQLVTQEEKFLSDNIADLKTKNISFDIRHNSLQGAVCTEKESDELRQMMLRYAQTSKQFIDKLFPHYQNDIQQARTSYRPVEISDRETSYRKDDTRLHVDSFPSRPTQGQRILRIFTNVNPTGKARVWRIGAPFHKVVEYFLPRLKKPILGSASVLHAFKITKGKRSAYDHYMLQLHNAMKADMAYQQQVPQLEFRFPPGSTWIVYTDQVSHAAMAGQFVFEQTSHLPISALSDQQTAPLRVLESYLNQDLVK
jgi:3-deoxy-D-manno-oct-2-ulosonic acid (Kdo) hydroxylase